MPWIDRKLISSDPRKASGSMTIQFPTSLSVGQKIIVIVAVRNSGTQPCFMGVRWVVTDPSGVTIQTFENLMTDSLFNVNGRFTVQGPLFTIQKPGSYNIKIDTLSSNTATNSADMSVRESYNGPLLSTVESSQYQCKIEAMYFMVGEKRKSIPQNISLNTRAHVEVWVKNNMDTPQNMGVEWDILDPEGVRRQDYRQQSKDWVQVPVGQRLRAPGLDISFDKTGTWNINIRAYMNPMNPAVVDSTGSKLATVGK